MLRFAISVFLLMGYLYTSLAQAPIPECTEPDVHERLVSLNERLEEDEFVLRQFQTLVIPNGAYVPISVNMVKGEEYAINFVVQHEFQQYQLNLIDQDKKVLFSKKGKSKSDPSNVFTHKIVAPYSGSYWVILSQKVKGEKQTCAGFSILLKGED